MQSELEQLLVLQDRDRRIKQIRAEVKSLPLQRGSLDEKLAAINAGVEGLKHKAKEAEVARKKLELDVGTRTETINRLRTQQYETRKNDEFRAIGHEIERYTKEIGALEDQELEIMEQLDQLKAQIAAEEKTASSGRESIARQKADLDGKSGILEQRLEELTKERAELASRIDEDLLDRFERIFASKGDAAIVALEHEVCTGCHMKVTTQTAHRAKSGKEIVSCEQCGRILYSAE